MAANSPTSITTCPSCGTKNRVPAAASGTPRCPKCKAALPWVADATDATYPAVVDQSAVPVVLDLWAPWCGPCRTVSPILEQLAARYAGQVKVVKVNVDENRSLSTRFRAQSIPLLVALRDGIEVGRQVGAAPEARLAEWMRTTLGVHDA